MLSQEESFHSRVLECRALKRIAANSLILGKHDPAALSDCRKPINVSRVLREVIIMDFYACTHIAQCLRDHTLAEAAVDEEDERGEPLGVTPRAGARSG